MRQGIARGVEADVLGQGDRQLLIRHRDGAAVRTVDHRDRTAPVALSGHAPVAQAELHGAMPGVQLFQPPHDPLLGVRYAQAVQEFRVTEAAVAGIGLIAYGEGRRIRIGWQNNGCNGQTVLAREIQVSLIVRRTAEDRPGAVVHQHEVGDVDRQAPVRVERMTGGQRGLVATFFGCLDGLFAGAQSVAFGDEGAQLRILGGQGGAQRVMGRERAEAGAEKRVRPCGEDLEGTVGFGGGAALQRKEDPGPFRAADPVGLHQADLLGPALHALQLLQQILGEGGDFEEPARQVAAFDRSTRAPALAVDDLLVGQDRVIDRIPVHPGLLTVDQIVTQEFQKQALLLGVVGRVAGSELARPVERQPHGLELVAHGLDVAVGPFGRMDLPLHSGILSRQAKGIPPHGMEHVEPPGALVARDHVTDRIVSDVTHVDAPRGVGEHLQDVVGFATRCLLGTETVGIGPGRLPSGLDLFRVVAAHLGVRSLRQGSGAMPGFGFGPFVGCHLKAATGSRQFRAAMRSSRARVRMAFSRSMPVVSPTCASFQVPPPLTCRKTRARTPSARKSRPRMKTLTLKRSSGLSGGEYQSVMITPPKGSAEDKGMKDTVSSEARQRKALTPIPVPPAVSAGVSLFPKISRPPGPKTPPSEATS